MGRRRIENRTEGEEDESRIERRGYEAKVELNRLGRRRKKKDDWLYKVE